MARARPNDPALKPFHRTLNTPGPFLRGMIIFLMLVAFLVAIIHRQLLSAFWTNPLLNGLIIAVLVVGILRAFGQVGRLYPEIKWVNAFRIADPGLSIEHKPVLLAPMATMLRDRRGQLSLSTTSMRSIMDSIGGRLDEARDTGRYLVGLLVFLGLLGTFWGLLETMQSVGKAIASLDTKQSDSVLVFEELKNGLAAPLRGMGTAFSASLMGLAGSLILGFLDLQASHAHNRFYNELEEWLSGITELTPAGATPDALMPQLVHSMQDMQRAIADLAQRVSATPAEGGEVNGAAVKELAVGIEQLVRQMRAEQKVVREWVDEQASRQTETTTVLKELASSIKRRSA
ncbi:MAG TPA: flagellar motor protein MotA [Hyphomicrobiaceae bacterium]|nr:flagellar motor protein MotA [Hyphomicrobiaceae bacterium]